MNGQNISMSGSKCATVRPSVGLYAAARRSD
jgi:hypothetical protein